MSRARFDGLLGAHDAGDFDRGLILGRQRQLDLVQVAVRKPFTPLRVLRNSTRLVPWRSISMATSSRRACSALSPSLLAALSSGSMSCSSISSPSRFSLSSAGVHRSAAG